MPIFDSVDPNQDPQKGALPGSMLLIGLVLAIGRYYLFYLIDANRTHDALWQFAFLPLWVLDFPITVLYFITPIPFGEAVVGPIWWFALPAIVWKVRQKRKLAKAGGAKSTNSQ